MGSICGTSTVDGLRSYIYWPFLNFSNTWNSYTCINLESVLKKTFGKVIMFRVLVLWTRGCWLLTYVGHVWQRNVWCPWWVIVLMPLIFLIMMRHSIIGDRKCDCRWRGHSIVKVMMLVSRCSKLYKYWVLIRIIAFLDYIFVISRLNCLVQFKEIISVVYIKFRAVWAKSINFLGIMVNAL